MKSSRTWRADVRVVLHQQVDALHAAGLGGRVDRLVTVVVALFNMSAFLNQHLEGNQYPAQDLHFYKLFTFVMSKCLNWQDKCNGVTPREVATQGEAPRSKSVTTAFLFPYRQAL